MNEIAHMQENVQTSSVLENDAPVTIKSEATLGKETPKQEKKKSLSAVLGVSSKGKVMEPICIQQGLLSCDHASQLVEYQWPHGGEYYLLQEQVSAYLNITSFKRKYPNIKRRKIDPEEITYLTTHHNINDAQVTLGLTALRSCDVHEMMMKEYPNKYKDFSKVIDEREKQKVKDCYIDYASKNSIIDKSQMPSFRKKVIKQAAAYNSLLNKNRKEDFSVYYDSHTNILQQPAGKVIKLDPELSRPSLYPCALIPGQFQEYCKQYSKQELMYLPVKTALYGPPPPPLSDCEMSDCDHDSSSSESSDDSMSVNENVDGPADQTKGDEKEDLISEKSSRKNLTPELEAVKKEHVPVCGICGRDGTCNKDGKEEKLIKCSQCDNHGHPSCLEMNDELLEVMKTYDWQCMECKTCTVCSQPYREDLMMFCDRCDRGYHTFCVCLRSIPNGVWVCSRCMLDDPKFKKRKTKELKALAAVGNDGNAKRTDRQAKSKSTVLLEMKKRKVSAEGLKSINDQDGKDTTTAVDEKPENNKPAAESIALPTKVTNGKVRRKTPAKKLAMGF